VLNSQEPRLRRYFHPVLRSTDVSSGPAAGRLLGERLVAWRTNDGHVHAAIDRCPHRGAALSGGWVDDGCLVCPYHAWAYGPDGRACHIPQLDEGVPIPPKARIGVVQATERYGFVWIALDEPIGDVPDFSEITEPGWRVIPEFFETWHASAARIIDNSLDIAHTAIVHRATIGDFSKPRVHPYDVSRTVDGLSARVPVDAQGVEAQGASDNGAALRDVIVEIKGPFAFVARITYDSGAAHVIYTIATPIDDRESLFVQFVARNDAADDDSDRDTVALDRRVTLEDQRILELTDPDFPLDVTTEVHLRCDRVTVEYRRYLHELLRPVGVLGRATP
jgi:phenylpropionate dioxygenase-like ring-hydroxylating dioxygenase large terminal subunit